MKANSKTESRYKGYTLQEWNGFVSNKCSISGGVFFDLLQEYFTLKKNEKSINMILKGLVRGIEKRI